MVFLGRKEWAIKPFGTSFLASLIGLQPPTADIHWKCPKWFFCVPSVCCLYAQKVLLSVFQKGSFPAHVLCVCPSDIERHPFSQKEISQVCSSKPEILPVTQTCIPTVFPVHPGHLSPKSKKTGMSREKCVPSVFRVYSKCIPSVFQMCSKCIPNVFQVYSTSSRVF